MAIFLSTNICNKGELKKIIPYLKRYDNRLGVEIFPWFHTKTYESELLNIIPHLTDRPVSFHGPYYRAEHSAPKGSEEYARTMSMVEKTLKYCIELKSRHFVFHHNNCKVTEDRKAEMIKTSCENYRELKNMFSPFNISVLVENAGVISKGNMLLDMEEFIELCKKEQYSVLIDIGHANANGWDLSYLINELKDNIAAYHLHNNDGFRDSHMRIHRGTINFDSFINEAVKLTPQADWIIEYSIAVSDDIDGINNDIDELMDKLRFTKN